MRRVFDLIFATIGLVVLSPLLGLIAVAIKLDDGGPTFYGHPRVGRNFRMFRLLKFRSMVANADELGGPVTRAADPRITRMGKFLRKYKLDELPQLMNVLTGDISVVGARPEVERYVTMFRSQYEEILHDRPGITDPATLAFRHEEQILAGVDVEKVYVEQVLPRKLELSLEYSRKRTLLSDLGVIIRTVLVIPLTHQDSGRKGGTVRPNSRG